MADNYLEKQYESYMARKAAMGKKTTKKKVKPKGQKVDTEAIEVLKEIVQQQTLDVPFQIFREELYHAKDLYAGYIIGDTESYKDCYEGKVYQHFLKTGKTATSIRETLARTLHDHSMTNALHDFLNRFDERKIVGIMGGHGLLRTDKAYPKIVEVSKRLTENGYLMISGGGPGAMEATHLGAWMAGRNDEEIADAIAMLSIAPSYKDSAWIDTSIQVIQKYPQEKYVSLGIPTWLYGHEPATPFASHIAKYFENSIREDGLLTFAKGGLIYSPGSAGTIQEIFQEAVQNHYLSFGYASPMIFMGVDYWTNEMPVYRLMEHLVEKGKYKNLILSLTDNIEEILQQLIAFSQEPLKK